MLNIICFYVFMFSGMLKSTSFIPIRTDLAGKLFKRRAILPILVSYHCLCWSRVCTVKNIMEIFGGYSLLLLFLCFFLDPACFFLILFLFFFFLLLLCMDLQPYSHNRYSKILRTFFASRN